MTANNSSPQIIINEPEDESRNTYINDSSVVALTAFLYNNKEFLVYAGEFINEFHDIETLSDSSALNDFYEENFGDPPNPG